MLQGAYPGMRLFFVRKCMQIRKSYYFDSFRCVASACPDSCCKEWDVQVDGESAAYYRSLTGPLGDRLRAVLKEDNDETVMTIENGRCPMWRADGLCQIQAELGEAALCKTCREFPRLTHDYGDYVERGLELSCPEAAKLILQAEPMPMVTEYAGGKEAAEYDVEAMAVLRNTREQVLDLLSEETYTIGDRLALVLLYGCQAQGELDGAEEQLFDTAAAMETIRELAKAGDWNAVLSFFQDLEILTPEWEALLKKPMPADWDPRTPALARYLVERYWLQAVSDYDLYSRVKFIVIACLLVKHLGGNILRTAQLFSKEIENSVENVEALLEGAYSHPAFTDDKLLGLLTE